LLFPEPGAYADLAKGDSGFTLILGHTMGKINLSNLIRVCLLAVLVLMLGCTSLNPSLKHPEVSLAGLHLLPAKNPLQRTIVLDLAIANPNNKPLNIRSIRYSLALNSIELFNGGLDQVPEIKAQQTTQVSLALDLELVQALRLLNHLAHEGLDAPIGYSFSAAIDFSAWLPTLHVDKKGALPLGRK